jgi:flagellar basal body-associated protein FliL
VPIDQKTGEKGMRLVLVLVVMVMVVLVMVVIVVMLVPVALVIALSRVRLDNNVERPEHRREGDAPAVGDGSDGDNGSEGD